MKVVLALFVGLFLSACTTFSIDKVMKVRQGDEF